jgi:hypothetical protein
MKPIAESIKMQPPSNISESDIFPIEVKRWPALGSTYKVVERDVLSSKETVFLKPSLTILHQT